MIRAPAWRHCSGGEGGAVAALRAAASATRLIACNHAYLDLWAATTSARMSTPSPMARSLRPAYPKSSP